MELPLWLSKGLYERKRRVLSVELPKVYREGWRTVFNADPNVVDLHKMGPYYYGLGSQMLHFDSPENPEIGQTLLQVNKMHKPKAPTHQSDIKEQAAAKIGCFTVFCRPLSDQKVALFTP